MAITTTKGHVSRALDFYNKSSIFFGIGGQDPWDIENNPTVPEVDSEIDDLIGMKKVESKFLIKPDPEGELIYKNQKWKIVDPTQAYEQGAKWVYVSSTLMYAELPVDISYRKVGLYTNTVLHSGVPSGTYVADVEDVSDVGILEVIDHRSPVYREADQKEKLTVVIEF